MCSPRRPSPWGRPPPSLPTEIADRAERYARRLDDAAETRLRARTVTDPREVVRLETDARNELARVVVDDDWQRLSEAEFSRACVLAYQALGEAIARDWAEALSGVEQAPGSPVPASVRVPIGAARESLPSGRALTEAVERTARQFEQLERLERGPHTEPGCASGDGPARRAAPTPAVVGTSANRRVTASFTRDGMLTDVRVARSWTNGTPLRVGQAITEAFRDAQAQGDRLEAEQAADPYAELSQGFTETQSELAALLHRSGLV